VSLTRRTCLKAAAALVAPTALPRLLGSPSAPSNTRLDIGIGTFCYHGLSIDGMIEELKNVLPANGSHGRQIEMSLESFMLLSHPPEELFRSTRTKLDQAGIRCVSYYAATIKDEQDIVAAVRFAQLLGVTNITGEGAIGPDLLRAIDRRVQAAGLTFGLHNHFVKGGRFPYQSPGEILAALEPLSERCGAAADTGHFAACGYDTVDAIRKLAPRLKIVHLKDVKAVGDGDNVVLGSGIAKIAEVEKELRRQNFSRLAAIEYDQEGNGDVTAIMRENVKFAVEHSA
jgi:sugar phosphate isomerase/epimerase